MYKIVINSKCFKFLQSIPKKDAVKIKEEIDSLAENPRKVGVIKLKGSDPCEYRTRKGDYRIIFSIVDKELIVYIIDIFNRKEGY